MNSSPPVSFCRTALRVPPIGIGANAVTQFDENIDAWSTSLPLGRLALTGAICGPNRNPAP